MRNQRTPNEFVIYEDRAEIVLYDRKQNEKARALIDLEDVERCCLYKWHCRVDPCGINYAATSVNSRAVFLHNFILNRVPDIMVHVDHKNRNGLDCKKLNLRLCTPIQNALNQGVKVRAFKRGLKQGVKVSKFKGVSWSKDRDKWEVQISNDGKKIHLGRFKSEIEAAKAFDKVARNYHGEFAVLNFP